MASFARTATTLSITHTVGMSTFNIYYGPTKNGNVVPAVYGGIGVDSCIDVGSISTQK